MLPISRYHFNTNIQIWYNIYIMFIKHCHIIYLLSCTLPLTIDTVDTSGLSYSNILAVVVSCASLAVIALVGCFGSIAILIYFGWKKRRTATENLYDYTGTLT